MISQNHHHFLSHLLSYLLLYHHVKYALVRVCSTDTDYPCTALGSGRFWAILIIPTWWLLQIAPRHAWLLSGDRFMPPLFPCSMLPVPDCCMNSCLPPPLPLATAFVPPTGAYLGHAHSGMTDMTHITNQQLWSKRGPLLLADSPPPLPSLPQSRHSTPIGALVRRSRDLWSKEGCQTHAKVGLISDCFHIGFSVYFLDVFKLVR